MTLQPRSSRIELDTSMTGRLVDDSTGPSSSDPAVAGVDNTPAASESDPAVADVDDNTGASDSDSAVAGVAGFSF
ncbi:hypothetical protein L228DRAFT_249410 [Xylona heveae TC161]|uniref:Uncharacterized protein n=1 Tax=Xylona heveae (strain CBS 132557 / TC161) TaxID=1328760 RepID=A0A165AKG9_XYLHT|nr:hypothetical protein L228DRAFT_249410 [Xylona heveae TC161]KZF20634.1 hypothetical protein L228DRAFT_249410 [Xylona heveae TC161]